MQRTTSPGREIEQGIANLSLLTTLLAKSLKITMSWLAVSRCRGALVPESWCRSYLVLESRYRGFLVLKCRCRGFLVLESRCGGICVSAASFRHHQLSKFMQHLSAKYMHKRTRIK